MLFEALAFQMEIPPIGALLPLSIVIFVFNVPRAISYALRCFGVKSKRNKPADTTTTYSQLFAADRFSRAFSNFNPVDAVRDRLRSLV